MSSTVEHQLERLSALSTVVDELRAAVTRTERLRDDFIRDLKRDGFTAPQLVNAAGVGRARLYGILTEPHEDADEFERIEWSQRFDAAWESALDRWLASHEQGHPDDYIPLEALFERR